MNQPILYLYTSLDAFQSIICTGKIRATHYRHLGKDPQEVLFGVGKLLEAVKQQNVEDSQAFLATLAGTHANDHACRIDVRNPQAADLAQT